MNPVLSGGGNDESSSESPEGEEKETPDDETQDNNPKIAKLTGMSLVHKLKFMLFVHKELPRIHAPHRTTWS